MNKTRRCQLFNLLLSVMLAIGLVFSRNLDANAAECSTLDIEGRYNCNVACIVRDVNDGLKGLTAEGEIDIITSFTKDGVTKEDEFYKVEIEGDDGFHEEEIGPRLDCSLYTATESVSDNQFPVLEEYIFQENNGAVSGFTKIVRNPSRADFKTCKVECIKDKS
ncbi:MAG: hypothetical protein F6K21_28240 [Symploca sp. SIO2D2]|nr:hypothetical protein [Symploca sp. SIO2D2]